MVLLQQGRRTTMKPVSMLAGLVLAGTACLPGRAWSDGAVAFTDHSSNEQFPAWSPDGTQIAFTRQVRTQPTLHTQLLSGGDAQERVPTSEGVIHPCWSPDGTYIMFSRLGVLWALSLTMGTINQATSPLDGGDPDEAPAWGSNGRVAIQTMFGSETDYSVGTVGPGGGVTVRITTAAGHHRWPSWSPDASQLVFSVDGDIKTIPAGGGSESPLVATGADEIHPEWSPLGTWVAYASNANGNYDIWMVPATGGQPIQVTDDAASDLHPTWSPDEQKIAFQSYRNGKFDIWIIDLGTVGTEPTTWGELKRRDWRR
jgi:Tol biopolymer transport system component